MFILLLQYHLSPLVYVLLISIFILLIISYKVIDKLFIDIIKNIRNITNHLDNYTVLDKPIEGDLGILNEKLILMNRKYNYDINILNKEKQDLLHYHEDVAHQIKTPLSSIRINEELKYIETKDNIYLENIEQIDHIDHLLDDILNISRFENNSITLNYSKINLKDTIESAIHKVNTNNINIILELEDILYYQDELWLQEAFMNIIKNSIKEDVTQINIQLNDYDQYIKCIIKDNGKGISEENISKIFNRYYRSKDNESKGFGIGLALSNEIIKAHHGYIHVYNDHGAVFEITLTKYNLKD
jgi:signal transduction histidine kinase